MKKVNFFKVMSAFVAFSAMTLASCTEEKMTITSPTVDIPAFVLPDAKATVSVSVYDVESNTILGVTNVDATPGQAMTVECPAYEGYIVAQPISVEIPALVAGQVAIVPVTFYVATEGSAAAAIAEQMNDPKNLKSTAAEAVKTSEVVKNDGNMVKHLTFMGSYLTGRQFESVAAVESRAAATGAEFIEKLYGKEAFETVKDVEFCKYWLNPWHQATLSYEQAMSTDVYTVEFNGATFEITFTSAGAKPAIFTLGNIEVPAEWKHNWEHVLTHGHAGHDYHGHGHGSENAGGGIVEAQ